MNNKNVIKTARFNHIGGTSHTRETLGETIYIKERVIYEFKRNPETENR